MRTSDLLVIDGHEVHSLLAGREKELIELVCWAYETHATGSSSLPQSSFLRFRNSPNRIIALPAYLGHDGELAGIKWISSFPDNIQVGLDRSSAVVVLNSTKTGRPFAVIEGSIISAKRTAASAALAAQVLHRRNELDSLGIVGCGAINFEIIRFLKKVYRGIGIIRLFDKESKRAEALLRKFQGINGASSTSIEIVNEVNLCLKKSSLISFATTATEPYISDLSICRSGATILNISLRDFCPKAVLSCDNVVDDVDHICQAQTSVHLAEQLTGNRSFIRCELAEITTSLCPARNDSESVAMFSPFGLGILDLALAELVYNLAVRHGCGTTIKSFIPPSWLERE